MSDPKGLSFNSLEFKTIEQFWLTERWKTIFSPWLKLISFSIFNSYFSVSINFSFPEMITFPVSSTPSLLFPFSKVFSSFYHYEHFI